MWIFLFLLTLRVYKLLSG